MDCRLLENKMRLLASLTDSFPVLRNFEANTIEDFYLKMSCLKLLWTVLKKSLGGSTKSIRCTFRASFLAFINVIALTTAWYQNQGQVFILLGCWTVHGPQILDFPLVHGIGDINRI